jgi:hypothetical protein
MRYIKKFENIIDPLKNAKHGDFVICREYDLVDPELSDFMNNNIGIISHIAYGINFYIYYDNVPENLQHRFKDYNNTRLMKASEIVMCSDDRKELEYYLAGGKYNL